MPDALDLAAIEARLTPAESACAIEAGMDDPTCAECGTAVHLNGRDFEPGEDVCHGCAYILLDLTRADVRALLAEVRRLTDERDETRAALATARKMLAECTVLSGADCDGNTAEDGWVHLWSQAVEEVRELRSNYDEALAEDKSALATARIDGARVIRPGYNVDRVDVARCARGCARCEGLSVDPECPEDPSRVA